MSYLNLKQIHLETSNENTTLNNSYCLLWISFKNNAEVFWMVSAAGVYLKPIVRVIFDPS